MKSIGSETVPSLNGLKRLFALSASLHLFLLTVPDPVHAFTPNTIEIGRIQVHPSLEITTTYNDNIFALSHDKADDFIIEVKPAFSLNYGILDHAYRSHLVSDPFYLTQEYLIDVLVQRLLYPAETGGERRRKVTVGAAVTDRDNILRTFLFRRYNISLSYEANAIFLSDFDYLNAVDQNFLLLADAKLPGGLLFRLEDSFAQSSALATYRRDVINFSSAQRARGTNYRHNLLSASAGYIFFDEYTILADYLHYAYDLGSLAIPLLGTLTESDLGLSLHAVGLTLTSAVIEKTILSIRYMAGFIDGDLYDETVPLIIYGQAAGALVPLGEIEISSLTDPRKSQYHQVSLGLQRLLTPKVKLEGFIGFQWRRYEDWRINVGGLPLRIEQEDFDRMVANARISWQIVPYYLLSLSFHRQPVEIDPRTGGVFIDNRVILSGSYNLLNRYELYASLFYGRDLYYDQIPVTLETARNDEHVYGGSVELRYRPQTWLSAAIQYSTMTSDADRGGADFSDNRFSLSLQVAF